MKKSSNNANQGRDKARVVTMLRVGMLLAMGALIAIPFAFTNHDPEAVSQIDNRKLASTDSLDEYFSDRIGFRSEMIEAYSALNDRLFHEMTHPLYEYGEEGHVFLRFTDTPLDAAYIESFADYILAMQNYCEERGIPFLYVISPEKSRIYSEYIPDSVSELAHSTDLLIPMLEQRGVNYLDQGIALTEAKNAGIEVFNKVYDAGHWNTEGMHAGSCAIIDRIQEMGFAIDDPDLSQYEKRYEEQTVLPASNYPISETTHRYIMQEDAEHFAQFDEDFNDGIVVDEAFSTAWHFTSKQDRHYSLLMFQGSYFNTQGSVLQHHFSELSMVHDYENVFNLPYYIDLYQPDVVIFENADYTVFDSYYSLASLESVKLPPVFTTWGNLRYEKTTHPMEFAYDPSKDIASFYVDWNDESDNVDFTYVLIDGAIYDCSKCDDGTFLWGATTDALKDAERVEVYGVDTEDEVMYLREAFFTTAS